MSNYINLLSHVAYKLTWAQNMPDMDIERLPGSLFNGKYLHCQPIEDGLIIEAQIVRLEDGSTPTFRVAIVCPARLAASKCNLRVRTGSGDAHCQYWKGDSLGEYQIIGPGMDKKSDGGYR